MNKCIRLVLSILFVGLLLNGCTCNSSKSQSTLSDWATIPKEAVIVYQPRYAENFIITQEDGQKILYTRYSKDNTSAGSHTSENRYIINPVHKAVCLSTSHIAFIETLHQLDNVAGVSGKKYIYSQKINKDAIDVGYESAIDYESLLQIKPDVVFAYYINGQPSDYLTRMKELGLNVILIHDHVEPHPLGRAEYLVAFSYFFTASTPDSFGRMPLDPAHATQFFNTLALDYLSLKDTVQKNIQSPVSVLINAPFKDIWYIPGEESHMNTFVKDAGGSLLGVKEGKESSTISLEQAYLYSLQADFWLNPNSYKSISELIAADNRFSQAPCVLNKNVWNNNRRSTPGGGNDFYESAVVYPNLILAELISIFHHELLEERTLEYYMRLE